MADPALTVLRLVHVRGQLVSEIGDGVDEWVPERHRQAGEDQHRPEGDDGDGKAAAAHPPPLQVHHERVEQQGDESSHRHEQDHVPQPVEQLASQIGHHHDGHRGEDRP